MLLFFLLNVLLTSRKEISLHQWTCTMIQFYNTMQMHFHGLLSSFIALYAAFTFISIVLQNNNI